MTRAAAPHGRRPWSIALRMTVWYAGSALAVIFMATGVLYWVLVTTMYQEDVRDLADITNNARALAQSSSPDDLSRAFQAIPALAPRSPPQVYIRVLDAGAYILGETAGMTAELPPPSPDVLRAIATTAGEREQVRGRSGDPFLLLTARATEPGAADTPPRFVQVAMDRAHDQALIGLYRERLWVVLVLAVVACAAVGYLIARSGMRPIERIAATAGRIGSATLHERIPAAGLPGELAGLADTFNTMLDRLQESFQRVSQFSDDVAHELRTPIGNLRGEIEVALGKARSTEEYRASLGSCLEECARLSRMIQNLLFLARSENAGAPLEREDVDLAVELAKVCDFYEALAGDKGVALRLAVGAGLTAPVDRTLFQQAVGNLVSNGIAHTPAGGQVRIDARSGGGRVTVSVRDTGCGIAAEHLPRVFERFYRVDRARGGSTQNAGLGLAIVKSIAARHGGRVEMESAVGQGTEVRLILPESASSARASTP
jgi:two-component system heavy metal sensor histidine kinase CusS